MSLVALGSANPTVLRSTQPDTPRPPDRWDAVQKKINSHAEVKLRWMLRGLSATLERGGKDRVGTQAPGERSAPAYGTETLPAGPMPAARARAGTGQRRWHLRGWGRPRRRGTPGRAACSG